MKNWKQTNLIDFQKFLKFENIAKKSGASIADTIILAGNVGLEKAIKKEAQKSKFHLIQVEVTQLKNKQKIEISNG